MIREMSVEGMDVQAVIQPSHGSFPCHPPLMMCEALWGDSRGCSYLRI